MPNWTLLIAIFLAFGLGPTPDAKRSSASEADLVEPLTLKPTIETTVGVERIWLRGLIQLFGGGILVGGGAWLAGKLGSCAFVRLRERGKGGWLWRGKRIYLRHGNWIVDWLILGFYADLVLRLGWANWISADLGLGGMILVDESLILGPFLIGQIMSWIGLHYGERALLEASLKQRSGNFSVIASPWASTLGGYLSARLRQSMIVILPLGILLALTKDLVSLWEGDIFHSEWAQLILLIISGLLAIIAVPVLMRFYWPTRPMVAGPARERLEGIANRFGCRSADILIWDTQNWICTAALAGAVPRFRYIFLTDSLVTSLDEDQVETVFSHEIGHVFHRHILFYMLFVLGFFGLTMIAQFGVEQLTALATQANIPGFLNPDLPIGSVIFEGLLCIIVAITFFFAFGHISRLFELQADLFACQALSPSSNTSASPKVHLSPVDPNQIETFVSALQIVALRNGIPLDKWTWRHGSMNQRIHFLQYLANHPDKISLFHHRLRRIRILLAAIAFVSLTLAFCL